MEHPQAGMSGDHVATNPDLDAETKSWIARRIRMRGSLDGVLAVLVVLFAIVLAAVPIRNSDIWLHLAMGRQLIAGPASGADDPFLYTADGTAGVGSSWLFGVLCYGIHGLAGDLGLGVSKAIVVGLLAAAILWAGWAGAAGWVPAASATLAMVALAPWLNLQPMLCSLLLLTLALWYLEYRTAPLAGGGEGAAGNRWSTFWPLYLLLAFWVNVDSWFLLGLFVLICYWLGGFIAVGQLRRPRVPGLAVCVGLLVCLASPRLHHAYRVPAELTMPVDYPWLADDMLFRPLFQSPLRPDFYETAPGRSLAGLAAAGLVGLGLLAVVLNRVGRHTPRLLACVGLLGLAIFQARNLPFLVVALAALAPRGLQEFSKARFQGRPGAPLRLRQAVTGRAATSVVGMALIVLAWLGLLQAGRPEPRALGVETDPSLVRAAEQMVAWRRENKLGSDSKGFNFSPDSANYFAWFCPEEKGFFDSRLEVCAGAAPEFALVRQGLSGPTFATASASDQKTPPSTDWREVLRRHGIDHIVLADRDRERTQAVLRYVLAAPDEWQVLFQAGRVLVLGWRDRAANQTTPVSWRGVDLRHDGLHPSETEKALGVPPERPSDPSWWEPFVPHASRPSLDRDEAALRMMIFEALRLPTRRVAAREWEVALAAAAVGHALAGDLTGVTLRIAWQPGSRGAAPGLMGPAATAPISQRLLATYLMRRDEAPPGQLWAGIRACRRALLANAQDAEAYLLLGQLYCRLAWQSSERTWGPRLSALGQVRKQQAIGALEHAVQIKPELDQAHGLLVELYKDVGLLDIALRHLQQLEKLQRERTSVPGDTEELERIAAESSFLERELLNRENAYERGQAGLSLAKRARLAQGVGLADKALEILLTTDVTVFGGEELQAALELLLWTGRADEAREWLKPEHSALLGEFDYHWLAVRLDLAAGDYAGADEHLGKLILRSAIVPELRARVDLEIAIPVAVGNYVLTGLQRAVTPQTLFSSAEIEHQLRLQLLSNQVERSTEFGILRGVMAIERGDAAGAERYVRQALTWTHSNSLLSPAADFSARPIAYYYMRLLMGSAGESRSGAGGP